MVTFIDNFILGIALTLPLGPITLEILRRGLRQNFFESIKCAAGVFAAELTYFTIVYLGLSQFSNMLTIKIGLGFLGVIFLVYIGYDNLKDFFNNVEGIGKKGLYRNPFVSGYLITFLNPLNFFMWAGIIGSFFAQNTSLFVSSGVLLGIFLSLFMVSIFSKLGRRLLSKNNMKYVSLVAGLFLVFYGLRLLYNLIFDIIL